MRTPRIQKCLRIGALGSMCLVLASNAKAEDAKMPPTKKVIVTQSWDDGDLNDSRLIDILRKYKVKGTFFINPAQYVLLEKGDRDAAIRQYAHLIEPFPRFLDTYGTYEGVEVGSHGYTHPDMCKLSPEKLRFELAESKRVLEEWFKRPVIGMAYPGNSNNPEVVEAVKKAGYQYARGGSPHISFSPDNPSEFSTTVEFNSPRFWPEFERVKKEGGIFNIFGHSSGLRVEADWKDYEEEIARIAADPAVQWKTYGELFAGKTGTDPNANVTLLSRYVEPPPDAETIVNAEKDLPETGRTSPHKPGDFIAVDLGNAVTMELKWIPSGEFMMGSGEYPSEGPLHRVRISKGFWMGKYEVTQSQWEQVTGNNPSQVKGADLPIDRVRWTDCQEFIGKLQGQCPNKGLTFRLPTEAEWEYACRAGTTTRFYTGDAEADLDRAGWYAKNSGGKPHPVGGKIPNSWGLYDMHGNTWEWCQDWYGPYPPGAVTDPKGPSKGYLRVARGGQWFIRLEGCRSSERFKDAPDNRGYIIGVRLVGEEVR